MSNLKFIALATTAVVLVTGCIERPIMSETAVYTVDNIRTDTTSRHNILTDGTKERGAVSKQYAVVSGTITKFPDKLVANTDGIIHSPMNIRIPDVLSVEIGDKVTIVSTCFKLEDMEDEQIKVECRLKINGEDTYSVRDIFFR